MRVLLASQEYPPATGWGGIGAYTYSLAHALAREGCEVHVVSCVEGQAEEVTASDGVTVHRRQAQTKGWTAWRLKRRLPLTERRLTTARAVSAAAAGIQPDVIEAPDWMAEGLLCHPTVVHVHAPLELLLGFRGSKLSRDEYLASRMEKVSVRRAKVVTAADPGVLRKPSGDTWVRREIRRLPPPLAADLAGGDGSSDRPVIAMVGRLDRLKAPELLIDAMARLSAPGVKVVLAGRSTDDLPGGRDYGEWIKQRAEKAGIQVEVRGILNRRAVLELYRTAQVVAVPSYFESFSMTAQEAMACGTAVVVTSACGIASWLEPLGDGWVVPPGDPEALAQAIAAHLEDAPARGQLARHLVETTFDPATVARDRLALYDYCLGRSPAK